MIVSVNEAQEAVFLETMNASQVPFEAIGTVTPSDFVVDGENLISYTEAKDLYDNTLSRILG